MRANVPPQAARPTDPGRSAPDAPPSAGCRVPASRILAAPVQAATTRNVLAELRRFALDAARPDFAAAVLRCLGICTPAGTPAWRTALVREALAWMKSRFETLPYKLRNGGAGRPCVPYWERTPNRYRGYAPIFKMSLKLWEHRPCSRVGPSRAPGKKKPVPVRARAKRQRVRPPTRLGNGLPPCRP